MEKEKVIKALETCIGCRPCKDCPFDRTVAGITNFPSCMVELQKEALAIINELSLVEVSCPVCNGKGLVQGNFYDVPGSNVSFGGYIENGRKTEICRNCNGKGTIIKGG
jgi:hypothetical protein